MLSVRGTRRQCKEIPGGLVSVRHGLIGVPPGAVAALAAKAFQMDGGNPEPALALLAAAVVPASGPVADEGEPGKAGGR